MNLTELIKGAEIVMWCSVCNGEPAVGEITLDDEVWPVGQTCVDRLGLEDHHG